MKLNSLQITATLFITLLNGCKSKSANELIINKWHLYEMSGKDSESIPDSIKTKMFKEASIEFMKDGKYQTMGMGEGLKKGTFHFSTDEKTIITTEDGGMPDTVAILELTSTKMIVKDPKADVKISFKPH